jgi:hypothetical protein
VTKLIQWTHKDSRGEQEYEGFQALAKALNVPYATAWRYVSVGFSSDDDIESRVGRPAIKADVLYDRDSRDLREYWREAQRKHRAKLKRESEDN